MAMSRYQNEIKKIFSIKIMLIYLTMFCDDANQPVLN
jgi:hypothetical protein